MDVEIINTGTELLLGEIVNTNFVYLASKLNQLGFNVLYQSTVGDNRLRMTEVITHALSRADIIITTGGLGPTMGDITKEVTAQVVGRKLILHYDSLNNIRCYFSSLHKEMPENNIRQAMIPEGAIVLNNTCGTAPGVILEDGGKIVINLPGPPVETQAMFDKSVIPYLIERFGMQGVIHSRILHTYNIGESALEEQIKDLVINQSNPTIALYARQGGINIRLTAKAEDIQSANKLIDRTEKQIRNRVGHFIYGVDDETLPGVVGQLLHTKKATISLAESCTGGLTTSMLTDIPGSSAYVKGSIVSYSNDIKINEVGVMPYTLEKYGAVSEQTAVEMAEGMKRRFETSVAVGITGIAGPGGATDVKPVGLVYIAITGYLGTKCHKYNFSGSRTDIKYRSAMTALNLIRNYLLQF